MNHQLRKVIIESDATCVVDCLYSCDPNISEFGSIIQSCKALFSQCHDVSVCFAPKSANALALALAQNARLFSSTQFWQFAPNCIAQSLSLDFIP